MNLIPSEETDDFSIAYQVADDFYRRVAHRVWELDKDPEKNPFDRKRVKQPSMSYMHNLSDEMLCDRWVENPYFRVPRSWCVSAGITVLKMGAGLPEPACRGRLQTTPGCCV